MAAANGVGGDGGVRPWLRQARGRARKEGGKNRGGRGVSRRGDREEVEPPARSRRWSLRARRFLTATAAALGRGEEDDRGRTPGGLGRTGAGPAGLPGERQVRFLSSLLFLFLLFLFILFCVVLV